MVCSNHFKARYVRFLIKYHLLIFLCVLMMTGICIGFLFYKRQQIDHAHLLRGFQAHGTNASEDYRKFIALIRETQISHLYPNSPDSKVFQRTPYPSFNPHINPCTKRFYLPTCSILPYAELTFEFNQNNGTLFDELNTFKAVCDLEWNLRANYTNCSTNHSCCQLVGPASLLLQQESVVSKRCHDITEEEFKDYRQQWSSCESPSSCSDARLQTYLTYLRSPRRFQIYLSIDNDPSQVIRLYEHIHKFQLKQIFHLKSVQFDSNDEEILFSYFLRQNEYFLYITVGLYFVCLFIAVKNLFFIFAITLHIALTVASCFVIYCYFLRFPITIVNYTSLTLYLFLLLIDALLWYTCWFTNNHRRDDCTIHRIIENLLTQTFFYLMPKNLAAILTLVITFANQIIAIQCFTLFSFLLISISFVISFALYPATFIFILRYQASIPTIEHLRQRLIAGTTRCFIDRTIHCLIVRLKGVWLILLTLVSCLAFIVIFQWPKLQFNICRLTFDILPVWSSSCFDEKSLKTLDIDVTYYVGSSWDMTTESLVPLKDIPVLSYMSEDRMNSQTDSAETFSHALRKNLSHLMQFCTSINAKLRSKQLEYTNHRPRSALDLSHNNSMIGLPSQLTPGEHLRLNTFHCFGDLSSSHPNPSLQTGSQFSAYIQSRYDQTTECTSACPVNATEASNECIACLNMHYYLSRKDDDLFLIKNGLRYKNDAGNPRYLLQTVSYLWQLKTTLNNFAEWKCLFDSLKKNFLTEFYRENFPHQSVWSTSELFSSFTLMTQLHQETYLLMIVKFATIFVFLTLFTGILGIFVTLTTLLNFVTCIATLTLLNFKLTVENTCYFAMVLIICSQYSVLYSISYKLAPTFFSQRENRTMYSLKQLCTTLFRVTFSVVVISTPCLFSPLPYLSKCAMVYSISVLISLAYSTFFLQSLLCFVGPPGHLCFFLPWRLTFTRKMNRRPANQTETSVRSSSSGGGGSRRHHRHLSHHRMSTSSHFASSYFSQIFTGSTYFESEYGGINENSVSGARRRESSRSHQASHLIKQGSLLTGELIELYTPRASLAPHSYHAHSNRYSRQSSVTRAATSISPARPLYISPSTSPYSQLSIHSQVPSRQRSPSPHICRPSRSPSPRSFAPITTTGLLRPCSSAPRLHVPVHRTLTASVRPNDVLLEETTLPRTPPGRKTVMIVQRQDAISSLDDVEQPPPTSTSPLSAATRRSMLKATTVQSNDLVWLKRSNSS